MTDEQMEDPSKSDDTEAYLQHQAEAERASRQVPINNPGAELERLTSSINTLYEQKRQQLTDTIARHALERTALANDYNRHMANLQYRADAAREELNKRQESELGPLQALVNRLEFMRA